MSNQQKPLSYDVNKMRSFVKKQRRKNRVVLLLPLVFPTMSEPDKLTVIHWYAEKNQRVRAGQDLLQVQACVGTINITMPPFLKGLYRVKEQCIPVGHDLYLGTPFIVLERVPEPGSTQSIQEQVAAHSSRKAKSTAA